MSKITKYLGLDRLQYARDILQTNGGVRGLLWNLYRYVHLHFHLISIIISLILYLYFIYRIDAYKRGTLIGIDKYGNKYYQNKAYFYGRSRWVVYTESVYLDYDGSQVPAEWHNWLHYMCDDPPTQNPRVNYPWMVDHKQNLSGSNKQYVPYSTTPPKIKAWSPPGSGVDPNQLRLKH